MDEDIKRKSILIVDDDASIGRILGRILQKMDRGYSLALSAEAARRLLKEETFDLILCDIRLPGESGMDLIEHVASEYPNTAVIMVSGVDDPQVVEKALEMGAYGYIVKPFKASEVMINISSALRRQSLELWSRIYSESLEQMVAERTAKLEETLDGVIEVVALSVETRDPYTSGHQRRVAELARAIGKKMGLTEHRVKGIGMAGMIHDLGKLSVPAEILSKPGRLNDMEFTLIKGHPKTGHDILKGIEFPWPIADMVYQHHERMNGSGYPRGLKGEKILLEARIMAVADVVEAMVSHRPYRPALGIDAALKEISKSKGVLYDPEAADACETLFSQEKFMFNSSWSTSGSG
jgi:putative two-component system response regulator